MTKRNRQFHLPDGRRLGYDERGAPELGELKDRMAYSLDLDGHVLAFAEKND